MMPRSACALLFATLLLSSPSAFTLVDPDASLIPAQPWMAQIFVDKGTLSPPAFCKGALINSQWVLTSAYCVYDPLDALGSPARDGTDAEYLIRFAGSNELHAVERFVKSDDFGAALMKLETPVAIQPVAISRKSATELLNTSVFVLGTESTQAIADYVFYPDGGKRMYCRVDGQVFFGVDAICYVLGKQVAASGMLETRAMVINPAAPGSPNSTADTLRPFDTTGRRLYLDFRAQASYPCNEDLGSPVLRRNEAGALEVVGIVSGVGMVIGFPVCNPSLSNLFSTASSYQDFIDQTLAQENFNALCPERPTLEVDYTGGSNVRVYWTAVAGATGYRLFYNAGVGFQPFTTLDVGNRTEIRTAIAPQPIYRAALVAYNDACTSEVSEELVVAL